MDLKEIRGFTYSLIEIVRCVCKLKMFNISYFTKNKNQYIYLNVPNFNL